MDRLHFLIQSCSVDAKASARDITAWLRSLGLGVHEDVFRNNGVDSEVLVELTDSDLEKFGALRGRRKRFFKAIASLGEVERAARPTISGPTPPSTNTAERRRLTVMFRDLVGSTALSAQLAPEDMRDGLSRLLGRCSGAVARYKGFIAKFMSDGVLAYFGSPPRMRTTPRAAWAGLDTVDVVAKLKTAVRLGRAHPGRVRSKSAA